MRLERSRALRLASKTNSVERIKSRETALSCSRAGRQRKAVSEACDSHIKTASSDEETPRLSDLISLMLLTSLISLDAA